MQEASLLSSLLQYIYIFSTLFVLYLVYVFGYCFFIKPYLRVRYFLRKGGVGKFCYGPQFFVENDRNAALYDNSVSPYIDTLNKHPNMKFFVRSVGAQALVILADLNLVKQFLQNQHDYDKSKAFKEMNKGFDAGLFFAAGENWHQTRKLLAPHFTFEALKRSVPMMVDLAKRTYSGWIKNGTLQHNSISMFSQVSGEMILKYLFNIDLVSMRTKDGKLVTDLIYELIRNLAVVNGSLTRILFGARFVEKGILPSHREFIEQRTTFVNLCKQLIREAKANGVPEDTYLYKLLETEKVGEFIYDEDRMTENLINLLIPGTDASGHNLGYIIYFLHKHPKVLEKLIAEIDREVPDVDKIDLDLLNRLDYTIAVVKETMRRAPPSAWIFFREVLKPQIFDNFTLQKGDLVTTAIPLFHLSEIYYSKPLEFIPERWLPDGPFPNDKSRKEPYSYFPFSFGPRNCIGTNFGMIQSKVMLILFVKTFKFSFPKDHVLKMMFNSFTEPVTPMIVTLEPISDTL